MICGNDVTFKNRFVVERKSSSAVSLRALLSPPHTEGQRKQTDTYNRHEEGQTDRQEQTDRQIDFQYSEVPTWTERQMHCFYQPSHIDYQASTCMHKWTTSLSQTVEDVRF